MTKMYCLNCTNGCQLTVVGSGSNMLIEGGKCEDGEEFAKMWIDDPTRTVTTTVRTKFPDVPVISVRTDGEVPFAKVPKVIEEINKTIVETELGVGDVLIEDVADTGVSVIITSPALMQLGAELENKNVELSRVGASRSNNSSSGGGESPFYDRTRESSTGTDAADGGYQTAEGVLDDIGEDSVGGFVGAAGEAVGIPDPVDEEEEADSKKGSDDEKPRGRARIRIGE